MSTTIERLPKVGRVVPNASWPTIKIGDSLHLINGRAFKPTSNAIAPPSSKPPAKAALSPRKQNSPAKNAVFTKPAHDSSPASSPNAVRLGKAVENTGSPLRPTPPTCPRSRKIGHGRRSSNWPILEAETLRQRLLSTFELQAQSHGSKSGI
jgi:hypothetical protein